MSTIQVIAYACGLGALNIGCQAGPEALLDSGLISDLKDQGLRPLKAEILRPVDIGSVDQRLDGVLSQLARVVYEARMQHHLPVILGGDHSSAIGTWAGVDASLQNRGEFGLLWVDAHMDSHTPQTSPSGALHGMPLANLLGLGVRPQIQTGGKAQKISPRHTCILGVRSFEPAEQELLQRLRLRVFFMDEINQRGMAAVVQEAMGIVCTDTVGYGLSMDLDALDPIIAPGVGSPEQRGINSGQLDIMLDAVKENRQSLLALELAEFNPLEDTDKKTSHLCFSILKHLLLP